MCGVLQGSTLRPLLFNMHSLRLWNMIIAPLIIIQMTEKSIYRFQLMTPSPLFLLRKCINEINDWMRQNLLQLNPHKTEEIAPLTPS